MYVEIIANQRWDVFQDTVCMFKGCDYTTGTRHVTPLTPRREVISHPVTKTKLTLTLIPTLALLTLQTLLNPNRSSKTMKLISFRRTSPQNHPNDAILQSDCIRDYYWLSACARP